MKPNEAKQKYIELLAEAENASGRKEAVKLIHKADKVRMKLGEGDKVE